MADCILKSAILCVVLSFTCHHCDGQERASENPPQFKKPIQRSTSEAPFPGAPTDSPAGASDLPGPDLPALEGRTRPPERVEVINKKARRVTDKWTREHAAETVKQFQESFPARQFPKEQFPLFWTSELQKLLWDENTDDKLRSLRKKRCQAALMECIARNFEYVNGIGTSSMTEVLESSKRLGSSLLDLEPDLETRLIIFRHNLAVARSREIQADQMLERGTGTPADLASATYERTDAEIRLLQEEIRQQERKSKVAN